jgi:hypothetical protein
MTDKQKDWCIVVGLVVFGICAFFGSLIGAMYLSQGLQHIIAPHVQVK